MPETIKDPVEFLYRMARWPSQVNVVSTKDRNRLAIEAFENVHTWQGGVIKFYSESLGGGIWKVWVTY